MHVQPSRGSIPEICGKCDTFDAFAGTSAKYRDHKESKGMKKANNEQPEKDLQCQAELCGLLDILVLVAKSKSGE
jgi:hypothetical protein